MGFAGAWSGVASLRADERSDRNVLLIVADDLRADVLGCYGDTITRSPNIDRLARRSMVFDAAYCQGVWCAPSRRSFMYGRYRDTDNPTVGETLLNAGIQSVRVSKIFHMAVPRDIVGGTDGQDVPACWGQRFNVQGDEAHTPGRYSCLNQDIVTTEMAGRQGAGTRHRAFVTVRAEGDGDDQPDPRASRIAVRWLEEHSQQRFFLAVGFVRPHYPMVAPSPLFDHYPHDEVQLPHGWDIDPADSQIPPIGWSGSRSGKNGIDKFPDNQKRFWSGYRASVEFMDRQVGRLIDTIEAMGLSNNTLIIFTSDHGYLMGDHTFWQKHNLHEPVTRVPLMVRNPDQAAGRSTSLVELVDLYPTVCQWMRVDVPPQCEGHSLLPITNNPDASVRSAAVSYIESKQGLHVACRTDRHALIRYANGDRELYDMQIDPRQTNNLADRPNHIETLAELSRRLDTHPVNNDNEPTRSSRN